jgi:hypothetical protein
MHFPGKTTLSAAALGAVLVFAWGTAQAADDKDRISPSVIQQGWAASPIPKEELTLRGRDPAQVALGSYLTTAGDCIGCHSFPRFLRPGHTATNPNDEGTDPRYGDPFDRSGPPFFGTPQTVDGQLKANFNKRHFMAGGRCFGSIQARNLTPDNSGKPRGLSEADFIEVMRTGRDISCERTRVGNPPKYGPHNEPEYGPGESATTAHPLGVCGLPRTSPPGYDPGKLMVMPFVTYHNLTDNDLKAIYAYLSSLPQARGCNKPSDGCAGPAANPTAVPPIPADIGSGPALGLASGRYAYTDDPDYPDACPNPPPPQ